MNKKMVKKVKSPCEDVSVASKVTNYDDYNKMQKFQMYSLDEKEDDIENFYEKRKTSFVGTVFGVIVTVNPSLNIGGKKKTIKAYGEKDYTHRVKIRYKEVLDKKYIYLTNEKYIWEVKRTDRDVLDDTCFLQLKLLGYENLNANR
jgi:ABC-type Fe3+ transport system substrate-binding protein